MQFPLEVLETPRSRLRQGAVIVLLLSHAVLAWLARLPAILTAQDDAYYLLLGRSLRHFSYADIFQIGAPAHRLYPPGYPGFLAVLTSVFGERLDLLVSANIVLSVLVLALVYKVIRQVSSDWLALASLAVLVVNPALVFTPGILRSETLFASLTVLALFAIRTPHSTRRQLIIAGTACTLAALTRTIGVALLVATAVHWFLERRWRAASVLVVIGGGLAGAWLVWSFMAPVQFAGASYAADFAGSPSHGALGSPGLLHTVVTRVMNNLPEYVGRSLPAALAFPTLPGTVVDNLFAAGVVVVGLTTGIIVFFRAWRVAGLYLVVYLGVLAVWPYRSGRFLTPLLPIVVPAILIGTYQLLAVRWRQVARVTTTALAAYLFAGGTYRSIATISAGACPRGSRYPDRSCVSPDQASFFATLRFIEANTPADATFLTAKPQPLFYYTGRQTISREAAAAQTPGTLTGFLQNQNVDYILLASLNSLEMSRFPDLLEPNCRTLAVVAQFPPRTALFRPRAQADPDDTTACEVLADLRRANLNRDFASEFNPARHNKRRQ